MSLLDEAIREHLDLKRRRGADPAEVARQERDALGPTQPGGDAAVEPIDAAEQPGDMAPAVDQPTELMDAGAVEQPTQLLHSDDLPDEELEPPVAHEQVAPPSDMGVAGHVDEDEPLAGSDDALEETPEHDRAWFDQHPPRDFDFDG